MLVKGKGGYRELCECRRDMKRDEIRGRCRAEEMSVSTDSLIMSFLCILIIELYPVTHSRIKLRILRNANS